MKNYLYTLCCLFFTFSLAAQESWIVQFAYGQEIEEQKWPNHWDLRVLRPLVPALNIWELQLGPTAAQELADWPRVVALQKNHSLRPRLIPNDPDLNQQWHLENNGSNGGLVDADIDATAAWDLAQGGQTALGQQLVIAVIDDGLDTTLTELQGRLWTNTAEIPNNGLDDDGNGFIDDFKGWSSFNQNDEISGGTFGASHGSPVSSLIAGQANNNSLGTGIDWYSQLLTLVGGGSNEAEAIAAYAYPLAQRRAYNRSGGQKGALIVAINASWGVDEVLATDFPVLTNLFDSLGQAGILVVASTSNANNNVDLVGDLPTHSPSPYLITVTNSNRSDQKVTAAGFGRQSIDLAAPGDGLYTQMKGGSMGNFSGTSAAAPLVTAAIGLIYSLPCPRLAYLAQLQPAATALYVKNAILAGVDSLPQLDTFCLSGGRLNLAQALAAAEYSDCQLPGCTAPYNLSFLSNQPDSLLLSWSNQADSSFLRYRLLGQSNWQLLSTSDSFLLLDQLQPCQTYELALWSSCNGQASTDTNYVFWESQGCCNAPQLWQLDSSGGDFLALSFSEIAAAQSYTLTYGPIGQGSSQTLQSSQSNFILPNLDSCQAYEIRLWSNCASPSLDSLNLQLSTAGCGSCRDLNYCAPFSNNNFEWLTALQLGDSSYASSPAPNGYAAYDSSFFLQAGQTYPIHWTWATGSSPFPNWCLGLWVDLDRNGQFDSLELVWSSPTISQMQTTYVDQLTIPAHWLGNYRSRWQLKWGTGTFNSCGDTGFGETKDYCLQVDLPDGLIPIAQAQMQLYPQPARQSLYLKSPPNLGELWIIYDLEGRQLASGQWSGQISLGEWPAGLYILHWPNLGLQDRFLKE